jgi:selenide,water dikinase
VYRITDEIAMIQTLDFFTPVVDDPYTFGQIAAANSLSDVYAMGGEPKVALNIVGFPNCLDPEILGEILRGGADKVMEAGAVLIGGHSVQDDEPKYGLSVSGFVHPDRIYKNYGCKVGDVLILTKQIGSGIINTAVKAEMASQEASDEVIRVMSSLNRKAKEAADGFEVHACTDVTGFGLLGHCCEMAEASQVTVQIYVEQVAYVTGAMEYARMGLVPAGAYRNRAHRETSVDATGIEEVYLDLLYDPQTSGGLLYSIPKDSLEDFLASLEEKQLETKVSVIGEVCEASEKWINLV